jgi:L-threonylcarbamoyladenylate synthase
MDTRVLSLDNDALHIEEAASALRNGKLVAFPTETVYGLGVNADDTEAVTRLYEVKKRLKKKQLSLLICSLDMVKLWVQTVPPNAKLLMDSLWPGPLTIILPGIGGREVGLRFPDSKVAQDIVRLADVPVAATSANVSGMPAPINAEEVVRGLGGRIDLVLDGGVTHLKAPSTVVRVTSMDEVEIIRTGVISRKIVYDCIKRERVINNL